MKRFLLCASAALALGCTRSLVAPKLDPLPPSLSSLNLKIFRVVDPPTELQKRNDPSLEEALRLALAEVMIADGFHLVSNTDSADVIVEISVAAKPIPAALYHTTLTVRGPRGQEIDRIEFSGGRDEFGSHDMSKQYALLAHFISHNLVKKLVRSKKLLAFADEPNSKRSLTATKDEMERSSVSNRP